VRFGFEDYDRQTSFLTLDASMLEGGTLTPGQWQKVQVPLSAFPRGANLKNIKQFLIRMEKDGEVYLDNIRLEMTNS
jgi:hypothetical protein